MIDIKAHQEIGELQSKINKAIKDLERFRDKTKNHANKWYIEGVITDLKIKQDVNTY